MRSVMKVQVEIQPVARATTPTIGTARMTSLAGEKQPPALLAAVMTNRMLAGAWMMNDPRMNVGPAANNRNAV
jgi:hypothetical protein